MEEENKQVPEENKESEQVDSLQGYTVVKTVEEPFDVVTELEKQEKVIVVGLEDEKIIGKETKIDGDTRVDMITTEQKAMEIFPRHGMQLNKEGNNYSVTFEDGSKVPISEETSKRLIKNGVPEGDYVRVEGVRKVTEYEKKENKTWYKAAALIALIPLIMMLNKCGKDIEKDYKDKIPPTPTPAISDQNISIDENEMNQVLNIIYGNAYSNIESVLDPATVIRVAQDAYEATDYDMELMGDNLCDYPTIQSEIVTPGSKFVETVSEFKEKYSSASFDSQKYHEMIAEVTPLLQEHGKWIDTATSLTEKHSETTQLCIDKGIRGETYEEEKIVTKGQTEELKDKKKSLESLTKKLENVTKIEQGIKDGTIKYNILSNGDVLIFDGENASLYKNNQNVKTQTQSQEPLTEVNETAVRK